MHKNFRLLAVLGLAGAGLLSACAPGSPSPAPAAGEARIYAGLNGQAPTAPSRAASITIVSDLLAAHGTDTAGLRATVQARSAATRLTHLRMEQEVAGLRVHGAYVKATLNDQGQVLHVIEHLAPVQGGIAVSNINEQDALAAALAHLNYAPRLLSAPASRRGNVTSFGRAAAFHREPTVERVAFAADAGALREGFLVATWSIRGNQLDYTLVDGDGLVVSVEHRTNNDRYNVFIEDPLKGAQTVVSGPGAGNVESPIGWLGTGAQNTINISGNNARAYLDAVSNNTPDTGGTTVTDGDFLTAADLTVSPSTTGNRNVAVQNLFYLNNVVHDTLYRHGFDEAAGNFQVNNFGKGGAGNDPVNAEAQDGGGTDNANFATPGDGSSPRMQMYLWTGSAPNSYVTVSGVNYAAYGAAFGPALTTTGITGAMAVYNDGTGSTSDGCEASVGSLTGKVAIVDRGTCNFTVKVLNAQNAGAVGVIIVNNTGTNEAFGPGGTERRVKISSVMVGLADGTTLKGLAGASANLRKSGIVALQIDGDIDADIVFHEYGHGLTWRMIGGMSGKLAGAIGEGASDVLAFLINGDDRIGEYSYSNAGGIRRQPYDTYVGTYANANSGEVHNDGEIYAAAMWDVRRNYLAAGHSTDTVMDDFVRGMNFTPSTPAFEHMRDGMLQAAAGTGRECLIWRAFAARGIGVGASGVVKKSGALAITESYALPTNCQ